LLPGRYSRSSRRAHPTTHPTMPHAFFTIGHSNRSVDEFIDLLKEAEIDLVVDVRTVAGSRSNPQFNAEALRKELEENQIGYVHLPVLGGLRGKSRSVSPTTNAFWQNESFRNFADYATTPQFREGLKELMNLGKRHRVAIMCAEAVWWRCHRRIIADYLLAAGRKVFHIMGPGSIKPAQMTPAARPGPDDTLMYPEP